MSIAPRAPRPHTPVLLAASLLALLLQGRPAQAEDPAMILARINELRSACDQQLGELDTAIQAKPTDPELRFRRADCYYENGRYDIALADMADHAWTSTFTKNPSAPVEEALALHAILLIQAGRPGEAKSLLQKASSAWGNRKQIQRAELIHQARSGDRAGAWKALDAHLQAEPAEVIWLRTAGELASLDPDGVSPTARSVIGKSSNATTRYNRAARALNDKAPHVCLEAARSALPEVPASEQPRFRALAYTCAVGSKDLGAAAALLKEIGPTNAKNLPADVVIAHARQLVDGGQGALGVKLLALVNPTESSDKSQADTLKVRVASEVGDLDTALQVATQGQPSAASRANLARLLVKAGRPKDARPLLDGACPELKGEAAAQCYQYVEWMKKSQPQ